MNLIRNNKTAKIRMFQKWDYIFVCAVLLVFSGCSPQHNYAFQQFNANTKEAVLSIQGYVINNPEDIKDLKMDWNALVAEMSKKPGFMEAYLSDGIGDSKLVLAHSKWNDIESLRNAFLDQNILYLEAKLPDQQFEHLFNFGNLTTYNAKDSDQP